MTTIEKAEKIKYLLQLKAPSHSLAEGLRYWSSPDTSAREAHLLTLPVEEIDHICLTEFNAMREQIEQWRFYSQPNARADFVHLGKLPYWSPGQTVALLLGKNVDLVNWETLKDFQYGDVADEKNAACEDKLNHLGIPDPSHIASEYLVTQFLKLAHRLHLSEVFINGELKTDPVSVLEWATRESIPIPAPLKTALKGKAAQPVQALANPIAIAGNSNEPQANTLPADTVTAPVVEVLMKAGPGWTLKPSLARSPGYRWPLYQILKAAHIAGQPCPKARDVLDAWAIKPPPDVQVMPDGVKYNDGVGNPKEADLKAIQQAIKNLLN